MIEAIGGDASCFLSKCGERRFIAWKISTDGEPISLSLLLRRLFPQF